MMTDLYQLYEEEFSIFFVIKEMYLKKFGSRGEVCTRLN